MFKILDGREYFYQWDLERKLIVEDSTIKQVHFCNRLGNCSLIRATYEVNGLTIVDVPNVILQESFNLHVYGYDINYTKFESVFDIQPRTKPENYVNTEEELRVWDELEQKVIDLENIVSGEGIAEAVEKWLENNPVQAGATAEEAAQIEQNKQDIAQLQEDIKNVDVDLTGYATEKYVDDAIANIDIPEGGSGSADLTGYATIKYVDTTVDSAVFGLTTQSYVDGKCRAVQEMIPSVEGLASEQYVDDKVGAIEIPDVSGFALTEHEHEEYQTADEVQALIDASIGEGGGGSSVEIDNETIITTSTGKLATSLGGGGKTLKEAGTEKVLLSGTVKAISSDYCYQKFGSYAEIQTETMYTITYQLSNMTEPATRTVVYDAESSSSNSMYNFYNVKETDKYITHLKHLKTNTSGYLYLQTKLTVYDVDLTYFAIKPVDTYNYNQIEIGYIPIDENSFMTGTGVLKSKCADITTDGKNINSFDSYYDVTKGNDILLGWSNTAYGANAIHLGSSNYTDTKNRNMALGWNNQNLNMAKGVVIGSENVLKHYGINGSIILGGSNTTAGTSSYTNNYLSILGFANNISSVGSEGSVLIGYQNSLRSGNAFTGLNYHYFFGRGLSNTLLSGVSASSYKNTVVLGEFNAPATSENFILSVGNGTADNENDRKNALTLTATAGNLAVAGTMSGSGADYAEYFEWFDGNPEAEDRVGYAVALVGNKIKLASPQDEVVGIVSGTAMVIGDNAPWHWNKKYLTDEFDRIQYEDKEIVSVIEEEDEEGNAITRTITEIKTVPVINPEFDIKQEYTPREKRAEWDTVGLMGKILVRDDGSCEVGGYAVVADGGIVTAASAKTNMRVLERTSENIVRVLFK